MAEITSPRIASIGDSDSGPQDQPAQRLRAKAVAAEKSASTNVAEIGELEEDKHTLDEIA